MKKVIVAFDGMNFSKGAVNYAIQLAKDSGSVITGVFLHDLYYRYGASATILEGQPYFDISPMLKLAKEEEEQLDQSIQQFEWYCKEFYPHYEVVKDMGIPDYDLVQESRFADIIVVGGEVSFTEDKEKANNRFIKELLKGTECPVMIVPEDPDPIHHITLTYDGSASSVFAIKQFLYLFPAKRYNDFTVVSVAESDDSLAIPKQEAFTDFIKKQAERVSFEILPHGNAGEQLADYINTHRTSIVVMGAYGRNVLSRLLHKSASEELLKNLKVPVFITHI
ncbi:universal stress protein [Flectobacillus major]|jgi:nucleotide-binding universal stress UspA family protein|uniref:universal stress protein n=1 Tax=Flectobacillus major TaxID=103 RepID=UPI00040C384A|nr:universal stress protein [Flectobacillus major]